MQLMFALDETESCQIRSRFANGSPFVGEYLPTAVPAAEIRGRQCQVGDITLCHLTAAASTSFQRSPCHIAEDQSDLAVLWFVRNGSLILSTGTHQLYATAGEMALTRSKRPLLARCTPDADERYEVFHVIVEADRLASVPHERISHPAIWPAESGPLAIAWSLLTDAFENDGALLADSSVKIVEAAMLLIQQELATRTDPGATQHASGAVRVREILRFIELQLSNPRLSRAMAAQHCRLSERHLATLLEREGCTFTDLVWRGRIEKARQWLAEDNATIAEVAYGLGFKSPSHFTRKFRQSFGLSPRMYRAEHAQFQCRDDAGKPVRL